MNLTATGYATYNTHPPTIFDMSGPLNFINIMSCKKSCLLLLLYCRMLIIHYRRLTDSVKMSRRVSLWPAIYFLMTTHVEMFTSIWKSGMNVYQMKLMQWMCSRRRIWRDKFHGNFRRIYLHLTIFYTLWRTFCMCINIWNQYVYVNGKPKIKIYMLQCRIKMKNLDRLAYHTCPRSVTSEASFSILVAQLRYFKAWVNINHICRQLI